MRHLCLLTAVLVAAAGVAMPAISLSLGNRSLVAADGVDLYGPSACQVEVSVEPFPNGLYLAYRLANETAEPQPAPELRVPGVNLPAAGTERLDNWQIVQWLPPLTEETTRVNLHVLRTYPLQNYAPVLGLRAAAGVVGAAAIYDFVSGIEMYGNYGYDAQTKRWTLFFQPTTGAVLTEGGRRLEPWSLAPGATVTVVVAVQVAPAVDWLRAFTAYRDHFRETFGGVRQPRSDEPIYCYSLSSGSQDSLLAADNPQAFGPLPIHKEGWTPYVEVLRAEALPRGWRRCMTWGSVGRYQEHRQYNMAWEISTGWCPAQRATEDIFRAACREITMGIWWGRALSVSGGFDSGHRHPWDPANAADNAAARAELDPAYERGVRLIGLDGTNRSVNQREDNPAGPVAFNGILPLLHDRYPDMHWILEAASPDYLQVWAASFVWEKRFGTPFEFAQFLIPGAETNAILKNNTKYISNMDMDWQWRFDELRDWGLVPGVFSDRQGQNVQVLRWQDPATWPESVTATVGDLQVRFDGTKKWTIHRVNVGDYPLGIDTPGASYGAVARIRDLGFVGSGHVETGREEAVQGLQFRLDGQPLDGPPAAELAPQTLEIAKRSRIEGLELVDRWWVRDGVIEERANIRVHEPTDLELLYVFMYPWTNSTTDYLALTTAGDELAGEFAGDKSFRLNKPLSWCAQYDRHAGIGVVVTYLELPRYAGSFTKIWDQPSPYHKHYAQTLTNAQLTPGAHFVYHVRLRPFRATPDTWRQTAADLAAAR